MKLIPVRIAPSETRGYTVTVDGIDLSSYIEAISLTIDARDLLPRLDLGMPHLALRMTKKISVDVETSAEIAIPDDLAAALLKLGWTPPAADPATTEGK